MRDRICPPRDLEGPVLDKLKDTEIFATKQKGMMFAAALGFRVRGKTSPIGDEFSPGEGIRLEYFERPRDDGFIDALAVAATGSLEILAEGRQDERLDLFERYAAVGLAEMKKRLIDVAATPFDATLALLDDLTAKRDSPANVLPGLTDLI
jgi:dnd system-associated protein 4